jgi:hypothetical protein
MLLNGQRVAKHKTHVKRRTVEPVFNESFGFDLPSMIHDGTSRFHSPEQILNTISFEVQVLNHNGVTRNELIGQTMVGGVNCKHWQAVREQPGQQVNNLSSKNKLTSSKFVGRRVASHSFTISGD